MVTRSNIVGTSVLLTRKLLMDVFKNTARCSAVAVYLNPARYLALDDFSLTTRFYHLDA